VTPPIEHVDVGYRQFVQIQCRRRRGGRHLHPQGSTCSARMQPISRIVVPWLWASATHLSVMRTVSRVANGDPAKQRPIGGHVESTSYRRSTRWFLRICRRFGICRTADLEASITVLINPECGDLRIKRLTGNAQPRGGAVRAGDSASGRGEGGLDHLPLGVQLHPVMLRQ
jgi:hypothetical protein